MQLLNMSLIAKAWVPLDKARAAWRCCPARGHVVRNYRNSMNSHGSPAFISITL